MQTTLGRSLEFYAPFPEARFCGPRAWRLSLRREGWGLGFLGAPWGGGAGQPGSKRLGEVVLGGSGVLVRKPQENR